RRDGPALDEADHVTSEVKVALGRGPDASSGGARVPAWSRFQAALSLSADTYRTGFGKDLYSATLIGELPGPVPLTLNTGLRAYEKVPGSRDDECKLGRGASRRLIRDRHALRALDLTAAGGVLLRNRDRRSLWLGGLLLDAEVTPSLSLTGGAIFA